MKSYLLATLAFVVSIGVAVWADTPPPGSVTANQGKPGPVSSPWPVQVVSSVPLTATVTFPTVQNVAIVSASPVPVTQSTSPWIDTITNSTFGSTQSGAWNVGRTWNLSSGSDSVTSIQGTSPWVSSITNFPATQAVTQSTSPWVTSRNWTLSSGSDSVNVGNFPATQGVTQSTSPWVTSVSNFPVTQNVQVVGPSPLPVYIQGGMSLGAVDQGAPGPSPWPVVINSPLPAGANSIGQVTANAGANLNTSALALESGGHLASIDSKLANPMPITAASLPLPTGAATSANQTTANTTLAAIQANQTNGTQVITVPGTVNVQVVGPSPLPVSGAVSVSGPVAQGAPGPVASPWPVVVVAASPVPVTGTFFQATQPVSIASTVGVTQSTSPWVTSRNWTLSSGGGDSVLAAQSGTWNINNITGTVSLPTGAATSALQSTINTTLGTPMQNSGGSVTAIQATGSNLHVNVDNTIPVTISGTLPVNVVSPLPTGTNSIGQVTANAGTNLNTSALALETGGNLAGINGKLTTTANGLKVDGSAVTQPVSAASLPLPTGAATSANQTNASQKSQIVDGSAAVFGPTTTISGTNYLPVIQASSGTSGSVVPARSTVVAGSDGTNAQTLSTDSTGKLNVNLSGTISLPTGASTSALQTTGNTSLASIAAGTPTSLGAKTTANSMAVNIASDQTVPVSIASAIPLPTGAATSANQATENSSLSTIATNTTQLAQGSTTSGQNGSLSMGAVTTSAPSYTTAQTSPLSLKVTGDLRTDSTIADGFLSTIATNTGTAATDFTTTGTIVANNGTVSINGQGVYTVSFSITGTWTATLVVEGQTPDSNWTQLPINIVANSLPYLQTPSVSTNGTYTITGGGFTNVRIRASAFTSGTVSVAIDGALSQQTVIANTSSPDMYVTGASAQTATVNNILTPTSGTTATDAQEFKSASVQVVSTGTAGTFIFEGSNDNVNFQTIPVFNQLILTGTPITAAITATASQLVYSFPVNVRYIRLRIATTITGGSIQAFSRFMQAGYTPAITQVAQATTANLQTTSTIASGTVTTVSSVTSDNLSIPQTVTDVASAAITTTTTTATLTPTQGTSYEVVIATTAVSGTTPTMDIEVQESLDSGSNWIAVYDFPRITATSSVTSPPLVLRGNRVRYVQTIGGTTPSFTRAITRLQRSASSDQLTFQVVDHAINLNSAGSVTNSTIASGVKNFMFSGYQTGSSVSPAIQLECYDDFLASFYLIGSPITLAPGVVTTATVLNTPCSVIAAKVTTAGTGAALQYVLIRGF